MGGISRHGRSTSARPRRVLVRAALAVAFVAASGCTVQPVEVDSADAEQPVAVSTGGNATGSCVTGFYGSGINLCLAPGVAIATGNGDANRGEGLGGGTGLLLALSNGGNASGGIASGSVSGDAVGLVAASVLGNATGGFAVSGTGDASGAFAVSGTGNAGGGFAVSGNGGLTGPRSAMLLGVGGGSREVVVLRSPIGVPEGCRLPKSIDKSGLPPTTTGNPFPPDGAAFQDAAHERDDIFSLLNFPALEPWIVQTFGSRFAGTWIDSRGATKLFCVGLVNGSPADLERIRRQATGPVDRIVVVPTRYSRAQLHGLRDIVRPIVRRQPRLRAELSRDDSANVIAVNMATLDAAVIAEVLGKVPPDAVRFGLAGNGRYICCDPAVRQTRDSYPPYQAGLAVNTCTGGWVMTNQFGSPIGTTAGHCNQKGDEIKVGGSRVGTVTDNEFRKEGNDTPDISAFTIEGNSMPAVYTGEYHSRPVREKYTGPAGSGSGGTEVKQGDRLCVSARNSGFACGVVTDSNTEYPVGDRVQHGFVCIDIDNPGPEFRLQPGDSGSPWFQLVGPPENGHIRAAIQTSTQEYADDGERTCGEGVWALERELEGATIRFG